MLDRTKLESSYRESVGLEWLELTDLEIRLITLYRQIPEKDRRQVRRIAGYLAEPTEVE
ncbi:hypothetical protein [Pseudomonas sp. R3-18-08]|uniref:hypothetical protein n=1 Tax=Pseudomonas sp. R3-18-08 TaxID=1173283 RepID=UPI000F6D408A|nr:hypothetical protein [Pseudomonas sp. R3-18-08]AZF13856.1 hypothetical protein C4J92_0340 [Pseudomonas sp. R3-18-08]